MSRDLTAIAADLDAAQYGRYQVSQRAAALAITAAGITARAFSPDAVYVGITDGDGSDYAICYTALIDAAGNTIVGSEDLAFDDTMSPYFDDFDSDDAGGFTARMRQAIDERDAPIGDWPPSSLLVIDDMIAADPGPAGWTTFGIWLEDEPVAVGTIVGKDFVVHGGEDCGEQGAWATSNDEPDPLVSEREAIAEMRATLQRDDDDDSDHPVGICKRCGVTLYRDKISGLMSISGMGVCPGDHDHPGDWPHELDKHDARPDDLPEPGDRCKTCGADITWIGPSPTTDWIHTDDEDAQTGDDPMRCVNCGTTADDVNDPCYAHPEATPDHPVFHTFKEPTS